MSIIQQNEDWEVSYFGGQLLITDLQLNFTYYVELKDCWTKQNVTKFKFDEAVEKYGLSQACHAFKRYSQDWLLDREPVGMTPLTNITTEIDPEFFADVLIKDDWRNKLEVEV